MTLPLPRYTHRFSALAAFCMALPCLAQTTLDAPPAPPAPPPRPAEPGKDPALVLPGVEVQGQRSATEERRNSSAAKIVIDRAAIEQYGDSTIGEVLRRMPGVTQGGRPGRGGDIRMRGMGGGFTQILIDGERIGPGFSPEQITPEQVERIEIIRAPTAETGTRAIAGTINIILREPLRKLSNDIRAGLTDERGFLSGNMSWNHNNTFGNNGTYTFTTSVNNTNQLTDTRSDINYTDLATGLPVLAQEGFTQSQEDRSNIVIGARAQWRLGAGEGFGIAPFLVSNRGDTGSQTTLSQSLGVDPIPYVNRNVQSDNAFTLARLNANWMKRFSDTTRFELRSSIARSWQDSLSITRQDGGAETLLQTTRTDAAETSGNLNAKWIHTVDGKHTVTAGLEYEQSNRQEDSNTELNALSGAAPGIQNLPTTLDVTTRRAATYVQDDWELAPAWSANIGLRWEGLQTRSDDVSGQTLRNNSSVWSPLGHVVWRFDPASRDQIRLSLTQSYRAPTTQQLVARPTYNTKNPLPGSNEAATADRAGNVALKPETARGIDLAYEKYLKSGGILSANLFVRKINDLIRNVTTLETVTWAPVPRFVSRPQNLDSALTKGIEFDAKFQLPELIEGAAALNIRFNLSLYDSSVNGVPGPNNTIDQQPRATGNLGADYRLRGSPWSIGGNLAYTPAYDTQLTEFESQTPGSKRVLEAYALYSINSNARLRVALANIAPRDSISSSTIVEAGQSQTTQSIGRTDLSASVRLELKL
jgi:outer membrane receptor for ferrienterochelin and colicins